MRFLSIEHIHKRWFCKPNKEREASVNRDTDRADVEMWSLSNQGRDDRTLFCRKRRKKHRV